jgi:hypothetical protein
VRAGELVRLSRVQLHDERTATVHGSTRPYDVTGFHCTCPQSQKGTTHWCVHAVAVKLARTMAEQVRASDPDDDTLGNGFPVDDETLPLPLPPTSVDERLAHTPTQPWMHATPPQKPQEAPGKESAPMTESDYHGAPDAPAAILETSAAVVTRSRDVQALVESMAAWKEQRQVVTAYIKEQMQEGIDYYSLRIKGRDTKPTLSKAGSEKFLHLMKLVAHFEQDAATWQMLGSKEGLLCYTCVLTTREGTVVGEGRGARTLAQDGGDINKAVKMAQKSAQIDAILRTGCLSDCFTQDVGEPQEVPPAQPPARPSSADLRSRIWTLVKQHDPTITTREQVVVAVRVATGLELEPDNYGAIVTALEAL